MNQLQELNLILQEKLYSSDNLVSAESVSKNKKALKSLIKHITPTLSDDKVCRILLLIHSSEKE